jgi:hypothetical protein
MGAPTEIHNHQTLTVLAVNRSKTADVGLLQTGILYMDLNREWVWTQRDLNPRPPPCEGGDL